MVSALGDPGGVLTGDDTGFEMTPERDAALQVHPDRDLGDWHTTTKGLVFVPDARTVDKRRSARPSNSASLDCRLLIDQRVAAARRSQRAAADANGARIVPS